MIDISVLHDSIASTDSKIIMLMVDGLGGAPHPETGKSELETAHLPNLDRLARKSACGLTVPVIPGVSPGSGPGHLALFGYDPLKYIIGRGALEAMGVDGVDFQEGDVAARGNFCTVDSEGRMVDRRAGRIDSETTRPMCRALDLIEVDSVDARVYQVEGYRFVLRLRGPGLSDKVLGMDPHSIGIEPLEVRAKSLEGELTARAANYFVRQARKVLMDEKRANMVLLRGFAGKPRLPSMAKAYKLNPASIAAYPMYRGLTYLVGMKVLATGSTFEDELDTLESNYQDHDFIFIHYKGADIAGEDGDFEAKTRALEELDRHLPRLEALGPDVLMVAGDHATPAIVAGHSWHPVPFMLRSKFTLGEGVEAFNERACADGSLGSMMALSVMPLVLSHAGKMGKFGA